MISWLLASLPFVSIAVSVAVLEGFAECAMTARSALPLLGQETAQPQPNE
jgi:hypothetical protein